MSALLKRPERKVIRLSELPPEQRERVLKRKRVITVISTLIWVLGILVILYPFGARWLDSRQQVENINEYLAAAEEVDPEEYLRPARDYNAELDALHMTDPYAQDRDDGTDPYWNLLKVPGTTLMARITLPEVDTDLGVYHGTNKGVLRRGAGHLYGSSLPVGGPNTHTVISAHSGMPQGKMFDRLHQMKTGDVFIITTMGQKMYYEVERIQTILPDAGDEALHLEPGRDLATLVTCTPYGVNSHRLLVTGHRVPAPPDDTIDVARSGLAQALWWLVPLCMGIGGTSWFGVAQYRRLSANRTPGKHRL